jgi:hypothetical protein
MPQLDNGFISSFISLFFFTVLLFSFITGELTCFFMLLLRGRRKMYNAGASHPERTEFYKTLFFQTNAKKKQIVFTKHCFSTNSETNKEASLIAFEAFIMNRVFKKLLTSGVSKSGFVYRDFTF